ncbi:MAG: hypothetical protein ACTTHU_06585 [Treponema sp.]
MYIAIIVGIAVIVAIIVGIFFKRTGSALKRVIVDVISAETVIAFFKRPEVLQKLQQNKNLLAVAVREGNHITLACFNKETSNVEDKLIVYQFNTMADDLKALFGDKPMIVFS